VSNGWARVKAARREELPKTMPIKTESWDCPHCVRTSIPAWLDHTPGVDARCRWVDSRVWGT
jgi:hypothetical protein